MFISTPRVSGIVSQHMSDWSLVTGASSGIGRELAALFAADGFNLALVARNEVRLSQLAVDLRDRYRIEAKVLAVDLAAPAAPGEVFEALRGIPVSILANNAGAGLYGAFAETDLRAQIELMQVNMTALIGLTHLFLQPMRSRNRGRILNVASLAAFQPGPMMNVYYASKAFVYSFSCALAAELSDSRVTVTALCPGTTRTEFFERAHMRIQRRWPMMDARSVAEIGYRGLMKGKRVVIPGSMNRIASFLARISPAGLSMKVVRKIHQRA